MIKVVVKVSFVKVLQRLAQILKFDIHRLKPLREPHTATGQ